MACLACQATYKAIHEKTFLFAFLCKAESRECITSLRTLVRYTSQF